MSDVYKIQYMNNTLTYPGWNGYVGYEDAPKFKTLTLYASNGGTVTASVLTGMPGDTAQITTAYNTYYRFSGYNTAGGGSLNGNVYTFGDTDADISALYKVNYFTASGGWEKGSNVTVTAGNAANIALKYATASYKTSNVPTAWYATSNRWKPNGASAYSITLHPIMQFSLNGSNTTAMSPGANATAVTILGSTQSNSQTFSKTGKGAQTFTYNKTFTNTTQNITYGISGKLKSNIKTQSSQTARSTASYIATGTTGTWTATGIAP